MHQLLSATKSCAEFSNDCGLSAGVIAGSFAALLTPVGPRVALWFALVWLMYLADRLVGAPEDDDRTLWPDRHPKLARCLLVAQSTGAAGLLLYMPTLIPVVLLLMVVGSAYFLVVPGWGRRLKDIPGMKGVVVATLLAAGMWLVAGAPLGVGLLSFGLFVHVSATLCDLRDVRSDHAAGVQTLAVLLPRSWLLASQALLMVTAMASAALSGGALASVMLLVGLIHLASCGWLTHHGGSRTLGSGLDALSAVLLTAAVCGGLMVG